MTLTEANNLLQAFVEVRCHADARTADTHRCMCSLEPSAGWSAHYAADVVGVVTRRLNDTLGERVDLPAGDYQGAALALLEEGIINWVPPKRQAHRQFQWLEACRRELLGYLMQA